jgi:hypothetical protein
VGSNVHIFGLYRIGQFAELDRKAAADSRRTQPRYCRVFNSHTSCDNKACKSEYKKFSPDNWLCKFSFNESVEALLFLKCFSIS